MERATKLKEQNAQRMIKPPSKRMGTSESRLYKMEHATKQKKMHQNIKALETRVEKLKCVKKPKELPAIKMNLPNGEQIQGRNVVRVKNLSVNFEDHVLWRDASFVIKGGEKVALIGNNGSGKTTLLKQILLRCLMTQKCLHLFKLKSLTYQAFLFLCSQSCVIKKCTKVTTLLEFDTNKTTL